MTTKRKIEKLTAAQQSEHDKWHAKWFAIGSCTEPADRPRAEAAIATMYGKIGKVAPRFLWVDSPATAALAMKVLRDERVRKEIANLPVAGASLWDSLWASLRESLWDSLGASLRASLRDSLRDSLGDSLGASLRDSLGDSLGDSLRASLRDSLGASLRDSLRASLRDSLWDSLGDSLRASRFWGQMEASWVAFYLFGRDVLGVQYDPERSAQLDLWAELAQSCGWWWPFDGLVIVSERPKLISWETDRTPPRLHSATGPALLFRDGYYLHAWHGVSVPSRVIEEPESYTAEEMRKLGNSEHVRALAERLGWQVFLDKLGAKIIDTWRDPRTALTYELLDTERFGERQPRLLRMQSPMLLDKTQPSYIEKVPAGITTAKAARYWQFMTPRGTWPSVEEANSHKTELIFAKEA